MRNAFEVVREVGVHDFRMATEQQLLHLYSGLLCVAPSAVGVDFRWTVGFEDRLQHQHRCCHADPIPHGRDDQRPEFAVGLRYSATSWRTSSRPIPKHRSGTEAMQKPASQFIVAPRAQASRRWETQAPLGGKPPSYATVSVP